MTTRECLDIVRHHEANLCQAWERYDKTRAPGALLAIQRACDERDKWLMILARKCANSSTGNFCGAA